MKVIKEISRRNFCKTASCMLAGSISIKAAFPHNSKPANKEETMEKKVTAVYAKVISQKGTCAMKHKVGDKIKFTEAGVEGKICIHALYSMLPGVFAMMFESKFPWLEDPDTKTHACPDAYNPVVFEITRVRE